MHQAAQGFHLTAVFFPEDQFSLLDGVSINFQAQVIFGYSETTANQKIGTHTFPLVEGKAITGFGLGSQTRLRLIPWEVSSWKKLKIGGNGKIVLQCLIHFSAEGRVVGCGGWVAKKNQRRNSHHTFANLAFAQLDLHSAFG